MTFERAIRDAIRQLGAFYPIVYLGGPRQAGKTTFLRNFYPDLPYTNLEDPEVRALALRDPKRFLQKFPEGAILDEAQRVPDLFSYLQVMVDERKSLRFVLSGSQNFLLMESISQSLAGRVGILNLLPLSYSELQSTPHAAADLETFTFLGGYPGLHSAGVDTAIFFGNYIQTYLERDVRLLKNIGDLNQFNRFMRLCAGRVGQPLNMNSLATDVGLSVNTIKSWLSVLEASYLIFYVPAYHENFNKRIIKSPKFYFTDTGLLCHLLGIETAKQLETHYYYGNIVENAIIADLYKTRTFKAKRPSFWFWQDQHGNEVDLLIEEGGSMKAIEIKSSRTFNSRLLKGLDKWASLSDQLSKENYLIYAGNQEMTYENATVLPWQQALKLI